MQRRKALAGILGAMLLILGASGPAAAAGEAPVPCALLTTAEAARAMGRPPSAVVTQTHTTAIGQRRCFWDVPDDNQMRYVLVQIMCDSSGAPGSKRDANRSARLYRDSKKRLEHPQDIPGLGQAAYWGGGGLRLGAGLHVLAHQCYFTVGVGTGDPRTSLARAKELAAKVISRLP